MGWTCSTHTENEECAHRIFQFENMRGRNLGADGKTTLRIGCMDGAGFHYLMNGLKF